MTKLTYLKQYLLHIWCDGPVTCRTNHFLKRRTPLHKMTAVLQGFKCSRVSNGFCIETKLQLRFEEIKITTEKSK